MSVSAHVARLSTSTVSGSFWSSGYARLGTLLTASECESLRGLYANPEYFRSRIDMARYRFGQGEYQYLKYPLPALVQELRHSLYELLSPLANEWMQALRLSAKYPKALDAFLKECHKRGQTRPTPLLLRYHAGDYNCLHQDVYGDLVFPFQVIFALSQPGVEFTGGELLLVEQRPRAQSMGTAVTLAQGESVAITTRYRPVKSGRGTFYRSNFRHGVSPILSGERFTLGVIFHDAA
jgi:uncharacterized protein